MSGREFACTTGCLWDIGETTVVKVSTWREGLQLEGDTIKWIKERHPEIPTTQVIYSWLDRAWNRSFMIMHRAPGIRFNEAWYDMTPAQREDIADEVAKHVKTLTQHKSSLLETIDGFGTEQGRLLGGQPYSMAPYEPSWRPYVNPPFTHDELRKHLLDASNMSSCPESRPDFVLYHCDLSPRNIFVYPPKSGQKGRLAAIIDWQFAAYWPLYWVATSVQFALNFQTIRMGYKTDRWDPLLKAALTKAGFKAEDEWNDEYQVAAERVSLERGGEEYADFVRKLRVLHGVSP